MEADSFEKALDDYLQAQDYDNIHEAIYQFARSAFCAGWKAAKNDSAVMADIIILDPKKFT